jgi:hypothetical protein
MNQGFASQHRLAPALLGSGSFVANWEGVPLLRHLRRATPELVLGFTSALLYAVISLDRHLRFQSGVDLAIFDQALGDLTPERARAAGALTLFALPARRLAVVARRGRAA